MINAALAGLVIVALATLEITVPPWWEEPFEMLAGVWLALSPFRLDKSGREIKLQVARDVIQQLIRQHSIYEDESKRASGFRIYRLTDQARSRSDLRKAS